MMNVSQGGSKKQAICRYFASNGSCFYGNECQFLHSCSGISSPSVDDLNCLMMGQGSHSPSNELLYPPFSPPGLPPESKLQSYIIAASRTCSSGSDLNEKLKGFHSSSNTDVTTAMSSISLDDRKTPVMDFIPLQNVVNPAVSRISQTINSPSFTYNASSNSVASTPFGRFGLDSSAGNSMRSSASPPLTSQESSPLLSRRNDSPNFSQQNTQLRPRSSKRCTLGDTYDAPLSSMYQESVAGTTYFYATDVNPNEEEEAASILQDYRIYPGNPSHVEHMKPKANAPSFFMPDELKVDLLHRLSLTMAQRNPEYQDFPSELEHYHNLCPLENYPSSGPFKSATFGFVSSVFKATNVKTGIYYCLRRIHGFRLNSTKCMQVVDNWKKLQHSNLIHLREVFTTKAFRDHSIIFVYDYHSGADTIMNQYFNHPSSSGINGYLPSSHNQSEMHAFGQSKSFSNLRQHAGLLPESLIWAYIVQLSSALRTIHAAGLACRALDPTKIVVTGKSRLRLNCCGVFDVLSYDASQPNIKSLTPHFQQEDLVAFGKVVLALACNSLVSVQRENLQSSLELVARNYSADLRNLILYLLSNQTRSRNINDIMPMIGARFYTQLDAAQMRSDVIENELSKEVENGRLLRLLVKLSTINERPEFNLDPSWCETGDRYLIKLFRDYLFHQVTEDGKPWLDLAHIIHCLNKLDAGVSEKICLMGRDEQNVLVVSYAELKQYFEASFGEIVTAAGVPKVQIS